MKCFAQLFNLRAFVSEMRLTIVDNLAKSFNWSGH